MEVTQEELKQAKKEVSKLTVLLNKTLKWFPKIKNNPQPVKQFDV